MRLICRGIWHCCGLPAPLRRARGLGLGLCRLGCLTFPRGVVGPAPCAGEGPSGRGSRFLVREERLGPHVRFLLSVNSMPLSPVGGMSSAPLRRGFTYDFSIWYCPEDDHIASCISERLKKEGFRGYAEHQDQVAGMCVIQTAVKVIEASRVAILLLSAKSLGDPWCQRVSQWNLYHIIHSHGTKMIPVYVGVKKAEVPPFLQHLIELEYQTEFFFDRLMKSLRPPHSGARKARAASSSKAKS